MLFYNSLLNKECAEKLQTEVERLQADLATLGQRFVIEKERADMHEAATAVLERVRANLAADLAAAEQRGRESAASEISEPYRESMFPPVSDSEMDQARHLCGDNLFARIHGDWARHWASIIRRSE